MRIGIVLLVVVVVATNSACGSYDGSGFRKAIEECYKRDKRENDQLAKEIRPLLAAEVQATQSENSACDSEEGGGAWISYELDPVVSPKVALEKFYSAGWADRPQSIERCEIPCIARVGKEVNGRLIVATVEDHGSDARQLVAAFDD